MAKKYSKKIKVILITLIILVPVAIIIGVIQSVQTEIYHNQDIFRVGENLTMGWNVPYLDEHKSAPLTVKFYVGQGELWIEDDDAGQVLNLVRATDFGANLKDINLSLDFSVLKKGDILCAVYSEDKMICYVNFKVTSPTVLGVIKKIIQSIIWEPVRDIIFSPVFWFSGSPNVYESVGNYFYQTDNTTDEKIVFVLIFILALFVGMTIIIKIRNKIQEKAFQHVKTTFKDELCVFLLSFSIGLILNFSFWHKNGYLENTLYCKRIDIKYLIAVWSVVAVMMFLITVKNLIQKRISPLQLIAVILNIFVCIAAMYLISIVSGILIFLLVFSILFAILGVGADFTFVFATADFLSGMILGPKPGDIYNSCYEEDEYVYNYDYDDD